jgi:hypothetical protein
MVTEVPEEPLLGLRLVMLGRTVKITPLLCTPPAAVTTTLPVVAPLGTVAVMPVLLQGPIELAVNPLNVTVPFPCEDPKFVPAIATDVPTIPLLGVRPLIFGAPTTVNNTPLLALPATVTTTLPVVAPFGTGTPMLVLFQDEIAVARVPLKVTVLLPCELPKVVPVMISCVPTAPEVKDKLVMLGSTVKFTPLLATPADVVTTTGPVVAAAGTVATMLEFPQVVLAAAPLKVTVPAVDPKVVPVIVT